jgi:Tfp pilus assembly protein PilO
MKEINLNELLSKIDEKNRYYILGGVLIVVFLLDYFFVMQPLQINPLTKLLAENRVVQDELRDARNDTKQMAQFKEEVKKLKIRAQIENEKVLSSKEVTKALEQLSRIAEQEQIKIDQIVPLEGSKELVLSNNDGKFYSLPILIEARGGYHNLGRFFNKLETAEIFMNITHFKLAANAGDNKRHSAKMTIRTIVFEEVNK